MSSRRRPVRRIFLLVAALGCAPAEPASRSAPAGTDALLALGERVYFAGKYDSALTIWTRALEQSRTERDSVREARALTWLGIRAWKLADYPEARRLGEHALAMKRRWALQGDLFKSYNALGLVAWHEGRLGDATELLGQAAAAAQAAGDHTGYGVASGNLGLVQFDLGEFAEARRGFDSMRVVGHAAGDARVEANALSNIGMLEVRVGAPKEAVARLREALRLYRGYGDASGEQVALAQLATAWDALGEPGRALAAVDTALALARAAGLRHDEAENLETLASLHRAAGDYRRALELYAETAALKRRLALEVEAAADDRSEAEIHGALGATERARTLARAALDVHRRADARMEELDDLLLLAEIEAAARKRRAADSAIAAARVLAERFGTRRGRAEVALTAARIADRAGDPRGTLAALARASADVAAGGYGMEQEAYRLEMRALARTGRLDSAEAVGRRAVAAVERVRGNYASATLRTSYLADHRAAYEDLGHLLRRRQRLDEALEVVDAGRGRAFLEHIAAPRAAARRDGFERRLSREDTLLRRIAVLTAQLDTAEQELAVGDSAGLTAAAFLRDRLAAARDAFEGQLARTGDAASERAAAAGSARLSVGALARALAPDEAVLAYQVGADSLVTFAVAGGRTHAFVSAVTAGGLGARVRLARDLLIRSRTTPPESWVALDSLHEILIGPVRRAGALEGVRRLIVVPDGALTYLPFAALRDPATGRWLAEAYTISTTPAAAAVVALRAIPPESPSRQGASIFAPRTRVLSGTDAEALEIGRSVPGATILRDSRATESAVGQALARDRVVHLATHAELNPRNPLFSRIELAAVSGAGASGDGWLDVHEILGLTIRSRLVFLSGCETALGAEAAGLVPGEDYATLARAFHYAGAREVVATLWRVEDQGAAEFATRFYRHYEALGSAEALARAQREMMAEGRYRSPYYWAGYVLSGDAGVRAAQNVRAVSVR